MEHMITAENFETEVLQSQVPVLLDFYADWCGPCKMMGPVLESIAAKYEGKLKVAKCDTEENLLLAQKYNVMNIPNLKLFQNGEVIANYIGYKDAQSLQKLLEQDLPALA